MYSLARQLERLEDRRLLSTYSFTDLGNVGGATNVRVIDINDAGQVTGVADGHAFRWEAGVFTDLGTLGGATSRPTGINGRGQVVGTSVDSSGATSPFLWSAGVMSALPLGDGAEPVAINDAGDVPFNRGGRAMLWRNGSAIDLGELVEGGGAGVADINDAGQVVGSAYSGLAGSLGLPVNHAFIWQDGVMTDIGTAPFTDGSFPAAVNNRGQVAGSTSVFVNTGYGMAFLSRSFFYDGTTMHVLPVPSIQNLATDVNDAGQVVGTMNGRAYLYEDGVVKDLNALVAPGTPGIGSIAAINNAGQLVGYTSTGRALLLTPDPPPPAGPEVQVLVDGGEVFDGTGTVDFGDTPTGVPVTKTFSVRNIGGATLELSGPVAVPAGLTLVSGLSATSLAPGGVATFVVRQDATAPGVFTGEVSFGTNDADESTFNFNTSGRVAAARVIDDGASGFSVGGARPGVITQGYQGDARRIGPAYRLFSTRRVIAIPRFRSTATWSFDDVEPGTYRVSVTWSPGPDRAINAPFTILNGTTTLASVPVNQRLAPADLTAHGTTWKDLGKFRTDSGAMSVRLTNTTLGPVIADAVRIERVADVTTLSVAAAPPDAPPARRGALGLPLDRVTNDLIASPALPR